MTGDFKTAGFASTYPQHQPPPHTYQGVTSYPPPPPAAGFPQPAPPPQPQYYPQPVVGYAVEEGRPQREHHLRCCGIGLGWVLFIIGFFLGAIPWYVGTFVLVCCKRKMDHREKNGYVACVIAAVIGTIIIIIGVSTGALRR